MGQYLEERVLETLRRLIAWAIAGLEILLLGLLLLVLAIVAAKLAERSVKAILARVGLDRFAERFGVTDTLALVGLRRPPTQLLSQVAFVVVLLFVVQVVADALSLVRISELLSQLIAYVPRALVAALILLLGSVAAGYGRRAVVRTARDSGIEYASALGTLFFSAVLFVLGVIAVNQLQIQTDAIWLTLGWVLAGLALGLGLGFGLGSREIVGNVLAGFYARQIFPIGKEIKFHDERGVLVSITPTKALLEQSDQIVTVSNSALLREVVRQAK